MNCKHFKSFVFVATALALSTSSPTMVNAESKKGDDTRLQISERQLRDLSEAVHNGRHATSLLVTECSRENDVVENGEIDFIGTDIIPIIPATAEGYAPSWLPPRAKYLKMHMDQLASALPLLQDELNTLKAPDADEQARVQPFTAEMQRIFASVQQHYAALGPLTTNQPFDRDGIVREATAMNKDLEQIDKLKKDMYKSYKKDPDKGDGKPVQ
jgi:hypothetical protein